VGQIDSKSCKSHENEREELLYGLIGLILGLMEERSRAGTQVTARRRQGLRDRHSPKTRARPGGQSAPPPPLTKGQIWSYKETYVQIVDAGKTLIHYTMSAKPRQRGLRVQMATRETVQDFLKSNGAKLVSTE
jgi:hypothetical protein